MMESNSKTLLNWFYYILKLVYGASCRVCFCGKSMLL